MKKITALVLALGLALCLAVTAFAMAFEIRYEDAKGNTLEGEEAFGKTAAVVIGFKGEQTVISGFAVTVDTQINWYELRELFGVKLEESDIVTYYLLKDGDVVEKYTVDYMKDDVSANVVLKIKAENSALGEYKIVTNLANASLGSSDEAEEPQTPSEVNPSTGANISLWAIAILLGAGACCKRK